MGTKVRDIYVPCLDKALLNYKKTRKQVLGLSTGVKFIGICPRFGMSIYKTRVVSVGMFCFSNHIIDFLFKLLHVMVG